MKCPPLHQMQLLPYMQAYTFTRLMQLSLTIPLSFLQRVPKVRFLHVGQPYLTGAPIEDSTGAPMEGVASEPTSGAPKVGVLATFAIAFPVAFAFGFALPVALFVLPGSSPVSSPPPSFSGRIDV